MAHKQILFRSAAREKILRGATQLTDAVRVTLGPRSKSVLIEKKWGAPIVCNDGVTIAKEFDLKDPEENLGARMLRQAAEKTGDMVGHGRRWNQHGNDTRARYICRRRPQCCGRRKRNRYQARP
jgi:chaperonin GroEL